MLLFLYVKNNIIIMSQEKGGFFARFKKDSLSGNDNSSSITQPPPAEKAPNRPPAVTAERTSGQSKQAASAPATSEPVIDTVATFKFLCDSLADIGVSQLKVIDMTLKMLSKSLDKITEGLKPKG